MNNVLRDFPALIEEHFDVIDASTVTDSLGPDYLVFKVVPKQPGLYTIRHTFSDIEKANSHPTIAEKYSDTAKNIKEIKYESKYTLPIYGVSQQHFYKHESFYHSTNAPIAYNSVNDTILIPLIACQSGEGQEIELKKFEKLGGWDAQGSDILSGRNVVHIDVVNGVKELEFIHFNHFWGTRFHVIYKGVHGSSSIYAVFRAREEGMTRITGEGIDIQVEIVAENAPLKTHYGIDCKREEFYAEGGSLTTTFHQVFAPEVVMLRVGDIFSVKIKEFHNRQGEEIRLDTIVFESKLLR